MQSTEIGIVTVNYDKEGNIIREQSHFVPTIKTTVDDSIVEQLRNIKANDDSEILRHNANLILAGFFNQINEIELADRSEYVVDSEVVKCESYPNGGVKTCVLKYLFRRIV